MKERVTITLEEDLVEELDKRIDKDRYKNRSQQINALLTDSLGLDVPSKAVILAGGKGTRLHPLTSKIPKGLVEVQGKTITEHLFDLLKKYGVREVVLSIGHLRQQFKDYFEDGSKFGMQVEYIEEKEALGTAGPLLLYKDKLTDTFICSNGDELKNINIARMYRLHKRKNALATLALTSVEDPSQYGVARMDGTRILEFVEKPKKSEAPSNLINSGFYIIEPEVLEMIPKGFSMLEKDVFPKLALSGDLRGFVFSGQWMDAGTHERLAYARKEWKGID
ncbi:MAG: sugar phosphate nucleotidyltransferase [Nanoarchaeota archaeon]|nr:sugar phosphate nucleotidyltransferase [Nanoarchaeota archaeon]